MPVPRRSWPPPSPRRASIARRAGTASTTRSPPIPPIPRGADPESLMKLFYSAGACSLSPHIVAREAGIDVQLEKVDLKAKKTASGEDFLALNPKGYVPALQLEDGAVLTEGPAIVQYLGDKAPASGLVPANGTMDRYRLQETLGFINSEIHKNYSPLFDAATPEGTRSAALDKLKKRYALFEKRLEGKPFL